MKTEIKGSAAFAYVDITLEPSEYLITESNAMSSMDAGIDLIARLNGGLIRGLLRKFLGGETMFISKFQNNTSEPRRLVIVQPTPGQIRCLDMKEGDVMYLQPGAFLACTDGVKLGLCWAGIVSWISREGLFKLEVSGNGKVWYGAFGALIDKEINGELIIDTSHLVAYGPGITLKLQLAGGIFSSFFGGEGLVTRVEGKGQVVIQSRSIPGLTDWVNPMLWG